MVERQHECWLDLREKLAQEGIVIVRQDELAAKDMEWAVGFLVVPDQIEPSSRNCHLCIMNQSPAQSTHRLAV